MDWPAGRDRPTRIVARGRDLLTAADGEPHLVSSSSVEGSAFITRELVAVRSNPADPRLDQLAGTRAGGQLRGKLRELFRSEAERDTLQYLLLDDLAGATLISSWGWFAWDGYTRELADQIHSAEIGGKLGNMAGVCIGFAAGSSSIDDSGRPLIGSQKSAAVDVLVDPGDPLGWHDHPAPQGPSSRRSRWIDVARHPQGILVTAGFQDSAARPDGSRLAIHEYRLRALMEGDEGALIALEVVPHVLPHTECPRALHNLGRLSGLKVTALRSEVPTLLARELGCTHLNDVLRALSAVPALAAHLPEEELRNDHH